MSIANLSERLMFYTLQKSTITNQISNIQMNILSSTQTSLDKQEQHNEELQEAYYNYGYGSGEDYDPDLYSEMVEELNNDYEVQMASLTAWESRLDNQKETYENQLNQITAYENSYQKLLQSNIKNDFNYGGKQ